MQSLSSFFDEVPDPRQLSKVRYPLSEILFLTLCAMISGAESWEDIEIYGASKLPLLREFMPYKNGFPNEVTLHRVFSRLDGQAFSDCFVSFVSSLVPPCEERLIAIDGKASRGSRTAEKSAKELFKTATHVAGSHEENAKDHGRTETRRCDILSAEDTAFLLKTKGFPHVKSVVRITATRTLKEKTTTEERYYLSSLKPDAKRLEAAVRGHWSIENSLHWTLDVAFREDAAKVSKDHAPFNLAVIRHTALNLIQAVKKKGQSVRHLRKKSGWDDATIKNILNAGNS